MDVFKLFIQVCVRLNQITEVFMQGLQKVKILAPFENTHLVYYIYTKHNVFTLLLPSSKKNNVTP